MRLFFKMVLVGAVAHLSSCSEHGGTVKDVNFYLSLKNAEGKNLLDSATDDYYVKDSIRLYRLADGVKTEIYHPTHDAQRNFVILKNVDDEYCMMVLADEGTGNQSQTTTTLIQWKLKDSNNVDTVQTYVYKKITDSSISIVLEKITYNGTVVWDSATDPAGANIGGVFYTRWVEIVK